MTNIQQTKRLACDGCDDGHDQIEQVFECQAAQQRRVRDELDAADAAEPRRDRRYLARNARLVTAPAMPKYLQVGATIQYVVGLDRTWIDVVVLERQSNGVVIRQQDGRQVSVHASVIRTYLRRKVAR